MLNFFFFFHKLISLKQIQLLALIYNWGGGGGGGGFLLCENVCILIFM